VHDNNTDPSDGGLFVQFHCDWASYFVGDGDYYILDNCKFHVQGWSGAAAKVNNNTIYK
jgi:hypothetical protein